MSNIHREKIRAVFQRFITDESEMDAIFRGVPILTAVSIDSLALVHLVTELEKEFGIRFDLDTVEQVFENIHSLEAFLAGESPKDAR
jgi:acyl carrier protein